MKRNSPNLYPIMYMLPKMLTFPEVSRKLSTSILVFACFLLLSPLLPAQTVDRKLLGSGGSNSLPINAFYYVSWSTGEPVVGTANSSLPQFTQGFQQPELMTPLNEERLVLKARWAGEDAWLEWEGQAMEGAIFGVERYDPALGFDRIGETPAAFYRDYGVAQKKNLIYRVKAEFPDGRGIWSNAVELGQVEMPDMKIFPNPTRDWLYLRNIPPQTHFQLSDPLGRLVWQEKTSASSLKVFLGNYPSGLYLLRFQAEAQQGAKQILIKE
jgi:hypothetical protein